MKVSKTREILNIWSENVLTFGFIFYFVKTFIQNIFFSAMDLYTKNIKKKYYQKSGQIPKC